jgi:hypothetical protein
MQSGTGGSRGAFVERGSSRFPVRRKNKLEKTPLIPAAVRCSLWVKQKGKSCEIKSEFGRSNITRSLCKKSDIFP